MSYWTINPALAGWIFILKKIDCPYSACGRKSYGTSGLFSSALSPGIKIPGYNTGHAYRH